MQQHPFSLPCGVGGSISTLILGGRMSPTEPNSDFSCRQLKEIPQAAATPVWAAVMADKDEIGGHYLEGRSVAPINDTPPNPFADGVRPYALDAAKAKQLWAKSEAMVSAA
jgi:hypothetical protein